jgi:hypothetical protein
MAGEDLQGFLKKLRDAEIRMGRGKTWFIDSILFAPGKLWTRLTGRETWHWDNVICEFRGKDLREMWHTAERGDWLLWFATQMIGKNDWPTHQQVVFASCQCARLALKHVKPNEIRPLNAIETAEAWTCRQATLEEVRTAGHVADYLEHDDTAFCAAQAAKSAAWAVYAEEDGCCFRMAQAASEGASWAASAAGYEIFATQLKNHDFSPSAKRVRDDAEKETLRECANVVRRILNVPAEMP